MTPSILRITIWKAIWLIRSVPVPKKQSHQSHSTFLSAHLRNVRQGKTLKGNLYPLGNLQTPFRQQLRQNCHLATLIVELQPYLSSCHFNTSFTTSCSFIVSFISGFGKPSYGFFVLCSKQSQQTATAADGALTIYFPIKMNWFSKIIFKEFSTNSV